MAGLGADASFGMEPEQSTARLDPSAAIVGGCSTKKGSGGSANYPGPEPRKEPLSMKPRYLWIDDSEEYECAFIDRPCRGVFCIAWLPHPEHEGLGRCMRLPALPDEEE